MVAQEGKEPLYLPLDVSFHHGWLLVVTDKSK